MTLISFECDLAWYIAGTDPDKRGLCGPWIAWALTGRAREDLMDMAMEDIAAVNHGDDYKLCVKSIMGKLGGLLVPEVANVMDQ